MYFLSMHTDSQGCLSLISYRQVVECVPGSACVVVKKNMTNLEHFCIGAEQINDKCDIKLLMSDDDWLLDWWKSKHKTLKDWLLAEYKPYKMSQFEYDLLLAVKEWNGGRNLFRTYSILTDLKERGYFKNVDIEKTVVEILENSEVIDDD